MKRPLSLVLMLASVAACRGDDSESTADVGADAAANSDQSSSNNASDSATRPDTGSATTCEPSGASNDCTVCVNEKCADLVAVCQRDADCACVADCLGRDGVGGVAACQTSLGLTGNPPGFAALEECVAVACPDGDECSTPAGWMPAADVACPGSGAGIGGGSLADCSFDDRAFDPDDTVLQLESADGAVCARVERRNDGPGSLANTSWGLVEMRVGPLGEVAVVDQSLAGCWYSSHHNFRDWVHAWTGTRHFDLVLKEYGHGGARTYELYVFEQGPVDSAACASTADGTSCIDGPIELFPVNP